MIYAYKRRYLILCLALGLVPLWLWLAWHRFTLLTDRREMLPPSTPAHRNWVRFCAEFDYRNDFLVMAYSLKGSGLRPDDDGYKEVETAVQEMGRLLAQDKAFDDVFFKIKAPALADSALYYVSQKQLAEILEALIAARPWLEELARPAGLFRLFQSLGDSSPSALAGRLRPLLKLLTVIMRSLARSIETRGQTPYISPFNEYQAEAEGLLSRHVEPGKSEFFYSLADGKTYVIMARATRPLRQSEGFGALPADFSTHVRALRSLKKHLSDVKMSHPSVGFFVTGEAALETAEVQDALRDLAYCGVLGFMVLGLGTLIVVRCPRALLCIALANGVAAAWLAGLDSLLGPLNILTVQHWLLAGVTSMWWSFHTVLRFLLNLRSTGNAERAWRAVALSWAPEARWFLGASALLWLSLTVAGGPSLASLGIYCVLALAVVALEIGLFLPALLAISFHHHPFSTTSGKALHEPTQWLRSALWSSHRQGLTKVLQAICILTVLGLPRVTLDSNLLDLPPASMSCKQVENYLQPLRYSTLYAFSVAENRQDATDLRQRFLKLKTVGRCESINLLFPVRPQDKRGLVSSIIKLARLIPHPLPGRPRDAAQLLELNDAFGRSAVRLEQALTLLESVLPRARELVRGFRAALKQAQALVDLNNPGPLQEGLFRYESALMEDLGSILQLLARQQKEPPDVLSQLPEALKARTLSPEGKVLLRIYPAKDCWNWSGLEEFVGDLRRVDPEITGTPALLYDFFRDVRHGLGQGLTLFLLLGLTFTVFSAWLRKKSTRIRISAWGPPRILLPLLAGLYCLGLAGMMGLELNALNLWLWLLSIHLGWLYSLALAASSRRTGGEPVALAGCFLLVAICFLTANHEGMKSCGAMFALGIATQILTSFAWPRSYWLRSLS